MKLTYVEVGQVVNAHGIRGEVKIVPIDGDAALIVRSKTLYLNGRSRQVLQSRVHKGCALVLLEGVEDMDAALGLKGLTVSLRRQDVQLPEGVYFAAELLGLQALDAETGAVLGELREVQPYPAHDVYRIIGPAGDFLVPAVPAFIQNVDLEAGVLRIQMMEGLL